MNYAGYLNQTLKSTLSKHSDTILFGQNVTAGSCISGMTRGIGEETGCATYNTQNSENTLAGAGFGMMLNGVSSVYFMKQQDFLLLGVDQLVNTYNFVRLTKPESSFTIVTVVVDNGYQGMQSSLNNFGDFLSIARIEGYAVTNTLDTKRIIERHLVAPGFRILGVSQRLFGRPPVDFPSAICEHPDGEWFLYSDGGEVAVVCFNFSLPQGFGLCKALEKDGIQTSLLSVNAAMEVEWSGIAEAVKNAGKLIILDDTKSAHSSCHQFLAYLYKERDHNTTLHIKRKFTDDSWLYPNRDELTVDHDEVFRWIDADRPANRAQGA